MKIVLFGGTTEGRELSRRLAEAGLYRQIAKSPCAASRSRFSINSHSVRRSDKEITQKSCPSGAPSSGVEYLRLLRPPCDMEGAVIVESAAEAAAYLLAHEGRVLLTTGAKELTAYAGLDPERLFPRVLPSHEGLAACEALGIPHRNIIAMQGPFSKELNAAMIRQYGVRYLVSKDGGAPGGFPEKLAAAKETGAQLIVLRRPEEDGLRFDEVLRLCMKRLGAENKFSQGEKQR